MVGAIAAGMMTLLLDRSGHGNDYGQTTTVSSLREVLDFVATFNNRKA